MCKSINENKYIINRKCVLLQKQETLRTVAEKIGHTKQAVSLSIEGRSVSLRIHRKICAVLGVSLVEFWPELYGEPIIHQEVDHSVSRS
jgi:lambda repressor-like predicted transcriptional regulator